MRNKKLLAGHAKVLSAVLAAAVAMSGTACGKNASSRSSASGITASSSMDDAGTASTESEEALAGAIDSVVPSPERRRRYTSSPMLPATHRTSLSATG